MELLQLGAAMFVIFILIVIWIFIVFLRKMFQAAKADSKDGTADPSHSPDPEG